MSQPTTMTESDEALVRIKAARSELEEAVAERNKAKAVLAEMTSLVREATSRYNETIDCELAELPLFPRGGVATETPAPPAPVPTPEPIAPPDPIEVEPVAPGGVATETPAPPAPVLLLDKSFGLGKTLVGKLATADILNSADLQAYLNQGKLLTDIEGINQHAAKNIQNLLIKFLDTPRSESTQDAPGSDHSAE